MDLSIDNPGLLFVLFISISLGIPIICERLRIPAIVGLICMGIVVGPQVLGLVERESFVVLLGHAGLLFIVFVAGLEIDLGRFRKFWRHSLVFGSISYMVPQVLGALAAVYLLGFSWPSAILLGSMFGSHTLLAYPVAARLGIVRSVPVTSSVGGTIITDVGALMVLAVIANTVTGQSSFLFWGTFSGLLICYLLAMFLLVPRMAKWFYQNVPNEGARDFLFTVLLLFLATWLAEMVGLQPIIGAFFCGIALNRLIPERGPLMSRIQFVGKTLLVPVFLLSVGMLVDPRAVLGDYATIKVIVVMSASVVLFKWLAAFISGRILGYSVAGCWVMFGMSVNQAAATLAAVVVGFEIGLFPAAVVNGAVIMILVTTLIGPSCVEIWGRRLADRPQLAHGELLPPLQRIAIPLARPDTVDHLVAIALMLREPGSQEPLYPISVVTDNANVEEKLANANKLLTRAAQRITEADCHAHPITRLDLNIAEGIRRVLPEQQITSVIIGWNDDASFTHLVFGGILDQLLAETRQNLIVARVYKGLAQVRRILCLFPDAAERELSVFETMGLVKRLTHQLSARIEVLGPRTQQMDVLTAWEQVQPEVPIAFKMKPADQNWLELLAADASADDLIVLLSARRHRLSWSADLDSLPRQIAQRFPKTPLIVVYPHDG